MDHARQEVEKILLGEDSLVVVRANVGSKAAGQREFALAACIVTVVAYRKGAHLAGRAFREERSVGAGIDSAGKKHPYRHIADGAQRNTGAQLGHQALGNFLLGSAGERLRVVENVPVALLPAKAVGIDGQPRARR